jgi:hypothetical protein
MNEHSDPGPSAMPVNSEEWGRQLNLSNFVNAYYQFRDVNLLPSVKSALVVGPGQGLETAVFRWRGLRVVTYDIDAAFSPDHIGSVHDMAVFESGAFDVVIASHVLEHLPVAYLDQSLREIARVGRFALVYLPVAGRHLQARVFPTVAARDFSLIVDLFKYWERPTGIDRKYCAGMHYWEVGMPGFRVSQLRRRLSKYFSVLTSYRNKDWNPSYNFVLESKR